MTNACACFWAILVSHTSPKLFICMFYTLWVTGIFLALGTPGLRWWARWKIWTPQDLLTGTNLLYRVRTVSPHRQWLWTVVSKAICFMRNISTKSAGGWWTRLSSHTPHYMMGQFPQTACQCSGLIPQYTRLTTTIGTLWFRTPIATWESSLQ